MTTEHDSLAAFNKWYTSLRGMKRYGDRPAKGTIAAALVVLERLRTDCRLELAAHVADGGAQIAGLNLPALRRILERFGENREFPSEGGRTNRGNNKPMQQLLQALAESNFRGLSDDERAALIDEMQSELVQSLDAYYQLEQIAFDFDPRMPARTLIARILARAGERKVSGPVAQHLVGSKLALRFPDQMVDNFPYSAADDQAGRPGDYQLGDTAFHVTVAPTLGHAERCKKNVRAGIGSYMIVADAKVAHARALLEELGVANQVAVESVESFVGQNIAELSGFASNRFYCTFGDLLREYNKRVCEVETDGSLMIEIPEGLMSPDDG